MKIFNIILSSFLTLFRKEDVLFYHKPINDSVYESNGVKINYTKYADVMKQKQKAIDGELKETENKVNFSGNSRVNSYQLSQLKELISKENPPLFLEGVEAVIKILNIKI